MELYASINAVSEIRQLFCLKSLLHLVVVDFTHNPIASTANYRMFAIYHLSFIRALDAQPVVSLFSLSLSLSLSLLLLLMCFLGGW